VRRKNHNREKEESSRNVWHQIVRALQWTAAEKSFRLLHRNDLRLLLDRHPNDNEGYRLLDEGTKLVAFTS
jgi:hypothetical protein